MSRVFNSTSNLNGLVQKYEKEIGLNYGDVSGSDTALKEFAAEVNSCLDDFTRLAINSSGTWQFDDSNQTDYPIIKTNLVSGQRDYSFTVDGSGNLILDIYKVMVLPSATSTLYQEMIPIDQQSNSSGIDQENTTTGVPEAYDKTANGIFLDRPSSYNATNGLKVMINREASYLTYSDTTKKPGVPGIFHDYFFLKPARNYARAKSLPQFDHLNAEVIKMEGDEERRVTGTIQKYFGRRTKDQRDIMTNKKILYI